MKVKQLYFSRYTNTKRIHLQQVHTIRKSQWNSFGQMKNDKDIFNLQKEHWKWKLHVEIYGDHFCYLNFLKDSLLLKQKQLQCNVGFLTCF